MARHKQTARKTNGHKDTHPRTASQAVGQAAHARTPRLTKGPFLGSREDRSGSIETLASAPGERCQLAPLCHSPW